MLQRLSREIEERLRNFDKTLSVVADRASAGYYIDIDIDKAALARYGLSETALLAYTSAAIGGMQISTMYKGLERYSVALRLEEEERRSIGAIRKLQIKTTLGFVPLETFAEVDYRESASVIKSEMATPVTFVYITPKEGVSATVYKEEVKKMVESVELPEGYHLEWAGQSEYLESAMAKIVWIVPVTFLLILLLIYLALKEIVPTLIVFFALPFALMGGLLYIDLLGFNMSIAVIVGFLALLGIAAETAIVMIVYLKESVEAATVRWGDAYDLEHLHEAIYEGAVQRVRPKLMTVFATLIALLPIMYNTGVGSEVTQRIAAPMIGGVVSSALLSLVIIPLLYEIYGRWQLKRMQREGEEKKEEVEDD